MDTLLTEIMMFGNSGAGSQIHENAAVVVRIARQGDGSDGSIDTARKTLPHGQVHCTPPIGKEPRTRRIILLGIGITRSRILGSAVRLAGL